ncbi:MAG: SDR family oxidoreductase [Paracoccaceae bacterium]
MDAPEFSGRRILVTGAGGGLGRALVGLFSVRGGRIIGVDRDAALLDGLPLDERITFDLADRNATLAASAALAAPDRVPDVLICNAGWTRAETLADLTPEKAMAEIDLNLTATTAFTTAIAAAMAARGNGSIVFISSVNAFLHYGNPAYAAAKAGLNAFARALAVEYGGRGVRANAVCPGSIRTPAWDHRITRDPTIAEKLERLYPMGRIVTAEEVAETVAFLASDRASGITGVSLAVDAGLSAGNKPFLDMILGGME